MCHFHACQSFTSAAKVVAHWGPVMCTSLDASASHCCLCASRTASGGLLMLALTSGVKLKKRTYSVAGPFSPVHAEHTCREAQAQINSLHRHLGQRH